MHKTLTQFPGSLTQILFYCLQPYLILALKVTHLKELSFLEIGKTISTKHCKCPFLATLQEIIKYDIQLIKCRSTHFFKCDTFDIFLAHSVIHKLVHKKWLNSLAPIPNLLNF